MMSDISRKELVESIRKGINFLENKQLHSGEFATMRWNKANVEKAYVKTVFFTTFVLHSLKYANDYFNVKGISKRSINFLFREMEINGFWRYFGKNSFIHFDTDTISCVLASLLESGIELDYKSPASILLKYRNNEGLYYTWILDIGQPFTKVDNNIDRVVNANVLFFYSLLNQPLPEVEEHLIQTVQKGIFQQRSPYYDSPFTFIYCFTRVYADGGNSRLSSVIPEVLNYLIDFKKENNSYGDVLENALAAVGLLNCGCQSIEVTQTIRHLLNNQSKDGGWPIGIFHTEGPYTEYNIVYGSEELTTAIALEAISKYLKCLDDL